MFDISNVVTTTGSSCCGCGCIRHGAVTILPLDGVILLHSIYLFFIKTLHLQPALLYIDLYNYIPSIDIRYGTAVRHKSLAASIQSKHNFERKERRTH